MQQTLATLCMDNHAVTCSYYPVSTTVHTVYGVCLTLQGAANKSNPLPCFVNISTTNLNFYKKTYAALSHSYLHITAKVVLVANSSSRALRLGCLCKPTHKRRLWELCLSGALQILDLIDWLIEIMLYYHNIWLSYGTWTKTTPRFVTCKFDVCVMDCSNCVPAQKH